MSRRRKGRRGPGAGRHGARERSRARAGCGRRPAAGRSNTGFSWARTTWLAWRSKGVAWVPTVVTMSAYARIFEQTGRDPDVARRTLDHQLEQLAIARPPGGDGGAWARIRGRPRCRPRCGGASKKCSSLAQAGYLPSPKASSCAAVNGARLAGGGIRADRAGPAGDIWLIVADQASPSTLPESLKDGQGGFHRRNQARRGRLIGPGRTCCKPLLSHRDASRMNSAWWVRSAHGGGRRRSGRGGVWAHRPGRRDFVRVGERHHRRRPLRGRRG
ncbi:MAG: hypothetical protein MZV70_51700 [Desulfobacterales bacterium]|nr:hypothetical protein [Desulfobacterales bacterium]